MNYCSWIMFVLARDMLNFISGNVPFPYRSKSSELVPTGKQCLLYCSTFGIGWGWGWGWGGGVRVFRGEERKTSVSLQFSAHFFFSRSKPLIHPLSSEKHEPFSISPKSC